MHLHELKEHQLYFIYPTSVLNMRFKVPDLDYLVLHIIQSFATLHTSADESTMSQFRPPKKKKDK